MKTTCPNCRASYDIPDRDVAAQAARIMQNRIWKQPTAKQLAAARANGKHGGRPRKQAALAPEMPK